MPGVPDRLSDLNRIRVLYLDIDKSNIIILALQLNKSRHLGEVPREFDRVLDRERSIAAVLPALFDQSPLKRSQRLEGT